MKNNFIEIQSKEDLIKPFQNGEKKPSDFKIGTEHEKFVFHIDTLKPVSFSGKSVRIRRALKHLVLQEIFVFGREKDQADMQTGRRIH